MKRGNSIPNRIAADARYPHARIAYRDDDGCCAILKLGETWARSGRTVMCSGRALPERLFCGRHDHLWVVIGDDAEAFLERAFERAGRRPSRSLSFDDGELSRMEDALSEAWESAEARSLGAATGARE